MKPIRKIGSPAGSAARRAYRPKIVTPPVPPPPIAQAPKPMPKMSITIPTRIIKAALLHAASADVRYYLNGILIEPEADGSAVYVVATDGYRMIAIRVPQETAIPDAHRKQLILDRTDIQRTLAKNKEITLRDIDDDSRCLKVSAVLRDERSWYLVKLIDGRFPDWRAAASTILKSPEGASVVNQKYISDAMVADSLLLDTAQKSYLPSDEIVSRRGEKGVVINYKSGDAIGVIMGMRVSGNPRVLPDFAQALVKPAAAPDTPAAAP